MKLNLIFSLVLALSGSLCSGMTQTNSQPPKLVHNWEYLVFSDSMFSIHCGEHKPGFEFGFHLTIETHLGPDFFKTNLITAKLHQVNGTVLEPMAEFKGQLNSPMYEITGPSDPDDKLDGQRVQTFLPWGTNALQEGWLEVCIGQARYWLDIPYGLGRNPEDPLSPSTPAGPPGFAPPVHFGDHIVPWLEVQYDLGEIQNDWLMRLNLLNSSGPKVEVLLYKDPHEAIKSAWTTNSPCTSVRVFDAGGVELDGHLVRSQLEEGRFWRTDTFRIDRYKNEMRSWGRIEIGVGDKIYQVVVPSSLYKYKHGHIAKIKK